MRQPVLSVFLALALAPAAFAQEPAPGKPSVARHAEALADADAAVRRQAAWALWEAGDAAAAAATPLARAVVDEDEYVRKTALAILNRLAGKAKAAIPVLVTAMDGRSETEVRRLAWLVARLDPPGAFSSDSRAVRLAAAEEQMHPGEKPEAIVRGLLGLLEEEAPKLRIAAANALGMPGAPGTGELHAKAAAALRERLTEDAEADVRQQAAWALGWITRAKPVEGLVGDLVAAATEDPEPRVRAAALVGLRTAGESARTATPTLLELLGDPDAEIRGAAALTLATAAEPTERVIGALAAALDDRDAGARAAAATARAGFGEEAAPAADAIVAAFRAHDDPRFRRQLARAIGEVGGAAKAALPDLRAAFEADGEPPVEVAFAICRLAPEESGAALDRLVSVASSDAPGAALYHLKKLGPAAAAALPALEAALEVAPEGGRAGLAETIAAIRGE